MKKKIWNVFIVLYAIIAIFITICLLSYNEYKVSEFGDYSFLIVDARDFEPEFNKGSLIIVDGSYIPNIGDRVFFYSKILGKVNIRISTVTNKQEEQNGDIVYTLENNTMLKNSEMIGKVDEVKVINNAGTILGLLESKWGFLALIVFPSLIAFLCEVTEVVADFKKGSKTKEDK